MVLICAGQLVVLICAGQLVVLVCAGQLMVLICEGQLMARPIPRRDGLAKKCPRRPGGEGGRPILWSLCRIPSPLTVVLTVSESVLPMEMCQIRCLKPISG